MQIHGPAHLQTTTSVEGTQSLQPTDAANETRQTDGIASNPAAGADEISISQEADLLSRIGDVPDIRQERVDQIRAEIASGVYETEERMDTAVSRLLDEIG
jgi:flagellar biosynthesis anti-sigma factor FlgM